MFQKVICLILAASLYFSAIPVQAANAGSSLSSEIDSIEKNSLTTAYRQEEKVNSSNVQELKVCFDVLEAGEFLREAMKKRQSQVSFRYLDLKGKFDQKKVASLMDEILKKAMEHTGVPTEGDYLFWQYQYLKTEVDYTPYSMDVTCHMGYYTTKEQEDMVSRKAAEVLEQLELDGLQDQEKAEVIYDYICREVDYDQEHLQDGKYLLKFTAYGALVNGKAVCQGYAALLYRLLLEAGVDCRILGGKVSGTNHAWNLIRIGDYCYYADPAWDAELSVGTYPYFLKGKQKFKDHELSSDYQDVKFTDQYKISPLDYVKGKIWYYFSDVGEAAWYFSPIQEVCNLGMMQGTGRHTFEPMESATRAMLVQTLYNLAGRPKTEKTTIFSDVPSSRWFYDAVCWAKEKQITQGISAKKFGPYEEITRQQLAVFLYHYAGSPAIYGNLSRFTDASMVSSWAKNAMIWCVDQGILQGAKDLSGNLVLQPQAMAKRSECAAMLVRFAQKIK